MGAFPDPSCYSTVLSESGYVNLSVSREYIITVYEHYIRQFLSINVMYWLSGFTWEVPTSQQLYKSQENLWNKSKLKLFHTCYSYLDSTYPEYFNHKIFQFLTNRNRERVGQETSISEAVTVEQTNRKKWYCDSSLTNLTAKPTGQSPRQQYWNHSLAVSDHQSFTWG